MSDFNNIGKLKQLPLTDINSGEKCSQSEFLITAAAEVVRQSGERNWIPVIVKQIGDYHYQVVTNNFVYAVAQKAGLERVWCIVIEADDKSIEQVKILSQEAIPKVNLSTASRETIMAALTYIVNEPGSALKGLDIVKATNLIEKANRKTWSNFNQIATLKCGITKGKKLDAIAQVFFLSPPQLPPPPPPLPEAISIKRASREEIYTRLSYLSTYKIGGFEAVDPDKASDAIFTASKGKWKSLNPISKLECGIEPAKIKTIKTVFSL